ncbi:MAG: ABC transporter permease [Chloroflexi bacterium]|nr:ABC transporter permease [Chloroflexota bacterium]
MFKVLIRRLVLSIPVLLMVITITFTLGYFGPGDPLLFQYGEQLPPDPQALERARHAYGLDRPFHEQFFSYVAGLFTGNLGRSLVVQQKRPVTEMMQKGLQVSAQLGLAALVLMVIIGIPLGIIAAYNQNSWLDYLIVSSSALLPTIPQFVLAPILLIIFVLNLGWIKASFGWDGTVFSQKAILPLFILVIGPLLTVVRQTRVGVVETLTQDYIRTARAKGLSEVQILVRHALKPSMVAVSTSLGFIAAGLLTGALFVESIFAIPGFGSLIYNGLRSSDYPLILGTTMVSVIILMVTNFIVDLSYAWLDPRVRTE